MDYKNSRNNNMERIPGYDAWKLAEPDYIEPAPQYCEICDCRLYEDRELENETCKDCHIKYYCEECGEYSENITLVAETEGYCPDCYNVEEEDFEI